MWQLTCLDDHERELVVVLGPHKARALVGRTSAADIRTGRKSVSRSHAEFIFVNGECQVNDLGSSNGTFVNEQQISGPRTVFAGDEVRCGELSIRVTRAQAASAAPMPAPPMPAVQRQWTSTYTPSFPGSWPVNTSGNFVYYEYAYSHSPELSDAVYIAAPTSLLRRHISNYEESEALANSYEELGVQPTRPLSTDEAQAATLQEQAQLLLYQAAAAGREPTGPDAEVLRTYYRFWLATNEVIARWIRHHHAVFVRWVGESADPGAFSAPPPPRAEAGRRPLPPVAPSQAPPLPPPAAPPPPVPPPGRASASPTPYAAASKAPLASSGQSGDLQAIFRDIDAETQRRLSEGFEYPEGSGRRFSLSPAAQLNLLGLQLNASVAIMPYIVRTMDDQGALELSDASQLQAFCQAGWVHKETILGYSRRIKGQAQAANSEVIARNAAAGYLSGAPLATGRRNSGASARAPSPPKLTLHFDGKDFVIDKERFVIGRAANRTDLTIRDSNISSTHAAVVGRDGQFFLEDLNSTNGVFYNTERIQSRRIEHGDVFLVCEYELRFSWQ